MQERRPCLPGRAGRAGPGHHLGMCWEFWQSLNQSRPMVPPSGLLSSCRAYRALMVCFLTTAGRGPASRQDDAEAGMRSTIMKSSRQSRVRVAASLESTVCRCGLTAHSEGQYACSSRQHRLRTCWDRLLSWYVS